MGAPELAMIRGRNLAVVRFGEEHDIFTAIPDTGLEVGDVGS